MYWSELYTIYRIHNNLPDLMRYPFASSHPQYPMYVTEAHIS